MSRFFNQLSRVGLNGFFLCLLLMVFLAWLFPSLGSEGSVIPLDHVTFYGVSVIFFFYGLRLSPDKLRTGLRSWRLHIVVQSTTFVLFPLLAMLIIHFFGAATEPLWVGFFYLAALPSTVSSSVVMVSIAGGNMPAAIFNASISSIIGIFITPLWMSLYGHHAEGDIDLSSVVVKLCLQVLLPVIVGLLLHGKLGAWAEKYKVWLKNFDQLIILLIVFTAFSESFLNNMFAGFTSLQIVALGALMLLFFFAIALVTYSVASWLKFSREDRITILFCGSKKSLVQGAVMGRVLFPHPVVLGIILLPLMLYHALQLLSGSVIAQAMARNDSSQKTAAG